MIEFLTAIRHSTVRSTLRRSLPGQYLYIRLHACNYIRTVGLKKIKSNKFVSTDSEVCHPRCVFKLYGEVNSVKNTTINIWLNDGVYW